MLESILDFVKEQTDKLDLDGPVVEFGALQAKGQEGFADVRRFFPGLEYTGCDLQPGPGVDLIDDMEHSHFSPSSVGTVVCLETLEHVRHPWLALEEAYRILKPSGVLIVSVPLRIPIHGFPDDYWRMTASGLKVLMRDAGFEHVETWDGGEELSNGLKFPLSTFGVARKQPSGDGRIPLGGSLVVERMDGYRKSPIAREMRTVPAKGERPEVPIIVPLYGREEQARRFFEQLRRVTDGYRLVLIDNGFNDDELIGGLPPHVLIRNETNVGIIKAVNQGLAECDAPYIAVLHSDALILEEAWLDHIVRFMDGRPDVAAVGLCGRHGIREDGSLDLETTVLLQERFPRSFKPTWRFVEVAAMDGFAFVMRNLGFNLDESLGIMHYYDHDLSMQYIEAGYRVYAVGIDCEHLATVEYTSRLDEDYRVAIGVDDGVYYQEVRERFRSKWQHMLPIVRGYQDEAYALNRIDDLMRDIEELTESREEIASESEERAEEIRKASGHIAMVEAELTRVKQHARELERVNAALQGSYPGSDERAEARIPGGNIRKLRHYLATEGLIPTMQRTTSYIKRRISR